MQTQQINQRYCCYPPEVGMTNNFICVNGQSMVSACSTKKKNKKKTRKILIGVPRLILSSLIAYFEPCMYLITKRAVFEIKEDVTYKYIGHTLFVIFTQSCVCLVFKDPKVNTHLSLFLDVTI